MPRKISFEIAMALFTLLLILGVISIILSLTVVLSNSPILYYWSFYIVHPHLDGHLMITSTPEILLPWLTIGLASIALGVSFFFRAFKVRWRTKRI